MLWDELGLKPAPETQALCEQLRTGEIAGLVAVHKQLCG
jgi:hypothetical protein